MKKKFFSSLLMGALVATTLGTVTSCKDYDDDINNLQSQIDKLATKDELSSKVSELQGLISTNSSAISSLQTAVAGKTTLDEVKALLADYATKKYVDDADATLQAAIEALKTKDIADLKAAVEAAQKAADAADAKADANKAEVIEMLAEYAKQADLDAAAKAAEDAIEALKANNETALAAAIETLNASIDEALKAANAAGDQASENLAAIKALDATVKKAAHADSLAAANKAALEAAAKLLGAGFDETNTVAAAIAAINAQIGTSNTTLGSLGSRLDAVEALLNGGSGDESLTELSQKVLGIESDLKKIIGEYTTMVTDVDLYVTNADDYRNGLPDNTLSFIFLDQEKTTKFPAEEGVADAQIEFSADNKNVTTTDSLVVRVSPTNAELTASNISLINSQGVELSDLVEVADVKPYKNLITTRSASQGNGLWMVTFKVKEGADAAKLAEEVAVKRGEFKYDVKFAVAVKNTASADTRRVVSAYNVNVIPADYEPAKWNVLVDNRDGAWKDIQDVHNRFYYNSDNDFGAASWFEGGSSQMKKGIAEYKWKNEPQVAGATSGKVLAGKADERVSKDLIDVTVGKDININVASILRDGQPVEDYNHTGTGSGSNATGAAIKGFYVTLDKDFAIESNPSEWNAWKKYAYTNVGVPGVKPAKLFTGKKGYISIDDEDAIGDVIGFRVYVVNLDGTLVDPDGRAFYVQVDKQKESADLTATALNATLEDNVAWNGNNYFSKNIELTENVFDGTDFGTINSAIGITDENGNRSYDTWKIDVNPTAYGNNAVEPVYGRDYTITYVEKDGETSTDEIKRAKFAKVTIKDPTMFLDNGEYTAHTTLYRSNGTEVRTIKVAFSKQMPTEINSLAWVSGYNPTKQVFTNTEWANDNIYKILAGAIPQSIKLTDKLKTNKLSYLTDHNYTLYFKELRGYEDEDNKDLDKTAVVRPNDYYLTVKDVKDIDNKARTIDYSYNFGPISLTFDYQTAQYKKGNFELKSTAAQQLAMNFNSWVDFENIEWAKDAQPTLTYHAGYNGISTTINFGKSWAHTPGKANTQVKYNDKKFDVFKYTKADASTVCAIEVPVTTENGLETKYIEVADNVANDATVTGAPVKFAALFPDGFLSRENVTHPTSGSWDEVYGANQILAWNTEVANYVGDEPMFGTADKKVKFNSLFRDSYLQKVQDTQVVSVEFAPASLYEVAGYDLRNGWIDLMQKTYSVNPPAEGTLTIKAEDCFGHIKTWTLKVNIAK